MLVNEIVLIFETMIQSITAVILASTIAIGFLYLKFKNGIIFRIGLSIIVVSSYAVLAVDYLNYFFEEYLILVAIVFAVILLALTGFYLNNTIIRPINRLIDHSNQIAEGDLTINLESWKNRNDEIGKLYTALDKMINFLEPTVGQMNSISKSLATAAQDMASSSEEVNASSEEISSITQQMSKGAQDQIFQIKESTNSATQLRIKFDEKIDDVNKTTQLIEQLSTQVNMLALNASIEAARAGEYGRGFAVVADNIRNLAKESNSSVIKVQDTIGILRETLSNSIDQINSSIDRVASVAEETASGAEEASAATEEQAATMQELTASAQELANMAMTLENIIKKIKTK